MSLVICQVGKLLYKQSSSTVKRLGLELGGNAAFLVFPTADLDLAVTILHLKIIQDYMAHIWESLEGFKTFLRWLDVWPASSAMQDRLASPPTGFLHSKIRFTLMTNASLSNFLIAFRVLVHEAVHDAFVAKIKVRYHLKYPIILYVIECFQIIFDCHILHNKNHKLRQQ